MSYKILLLMSLLGGGYLHAQVATQQKIEDTLKNDPDSFLKEVIVTANREGVKRNEAPIAISSISAKQINYAKATTIDQLLNKVSGVNMVNLGNEQHQMSIRQPMTTKSLFLYLENGIPIRTSGLFNHNALLEINMAAVKNIEVIKGPSSSLYGSEAIGGAVNFITYAPSDKPDTKLSIQGNNIGYKRTDLLTGFTAGKLGVVVAGYYGDKHNSYLEFTDYHKGTVTVRADYQLNNKTIVSNTTTWMNYYSDMPGGIDSTMFSNKVFKNPQSFTYRKVNALRNHTSISHNWSEAGKTTLSLIYRNNSIEQNPAYRVTDDYRKRGDSWKGRKDLAHGEINKSSFNSYAMTAQHRQQWSFMRTVLIGGLSVDASPSDYIARYIKINKDTVTQKYASFQTTDSLLTNYSTKISNYAGFVSAEFSPAKNLRIVSSIRYDLFKYKFDNQLAKTSFSGSSDTTNDFKKTSIKVGATYNFHGGTGLYANYSEGFIPPQVSDMYTGVKVPDLIPSVVRNYEAGGWYRINNKLSGDISAYVLRSSNEVISTRMDDGSFANTNAGKTIHKGIELGLNAKPFETISFRLSGAYSKHKFVDYVEKGQNYNGKEMNGAPNWMYNAEVWYTPSFLKGLRAGAELQHIGKYYTDPQNTSRYKGYTTLNLRAAYQHKTVEFWINVMNATDAYYANIVSKSAYGYSYTVAEPINVNIGCTYNFSQLFKNK